MVTDVMSTPSMVIEPFWTSRRRKRVDMSEDFPLPERPQKPILVPDGIEREMDLRTVSESGLGGVLELAFWI